MTSPVSILIPCYNAKAWIKEAVFSVLNQTWRNLEVIVVDDGSTDGSAEQLAEVDDPRLKVIRQANSGQCAAANRAFSAASGVLIKFFDADDVLAPDHVALQVKRLDGRRNAIAMGEWARFYGDDPRTAAFAPLPMYRDASPAEWLASEWMNARPMMQCGLWLIPRDILAKSGLWDERLSLMNDFEFFTRVLLSADRLLYTPRARLHYRSGVPSSLSGRKTRKAIESASLSLLLATNRLIETENTERVRRACANILQDFCYTYYPDHADLRGKMRARVIALGGSDIAPDGPPGFHKLRHVIGWKPARLMQHAYDTLRQSTRTFICENGSLHLPANRK